MKQSREEKNETLVRFQPRKREDHSAGLSISLDPILHLQRAAGNNAVVRLLKSEGHTQTRQETDLSQDAPARLPSIGIPAKRTVNQPGDIYEQEADRVAEQVTNMPAAQAQRPCACGGGCPTCQNKQSTPEQLQMKSVGANDSANIEAPSIVNEVISSSGQPLDTSTRSFMEMRFGHDLGSVRVHTDETAADAAGALHANAFTVGRHIVFGDGRFAPGASKGRHLLAHELTHFVQQSSSSAGTGAAGFVQRDEKTEKEVKGVISPHVQAIEADLSSDQTQLAKRMAKRRKEIKEMLDELGPAPKSEKAKERVKALEKDLAKDLQTIINEADSPYVNKALRKDIKESAGHVDAKKLKLKGAQDQWSKYDPIFAGAEVAAALGKQTLTGAELKALVAQESGDLTQSDPRGDIAGIAQLGTKEEKLGGGKPDDRKKPEKALLIVAKIISTYAANLDNALTAKPVGVERKKFIMAAYNSGYPTIIRAQAEAIKMKRDGITWQSLIDGGKQSPLYKAIVALYPKGTKYDTTFKEKSEYPIKVRARLP